MTEQHDSHVLAQFAYFNMLKYGFKKRDRVRLKHARPLPSGRYVQLVGLLDYQRKDGFWDIRISTPGLYGGGILICKPDEFELDDGKIRFKITKAGTNSEGHPAGTICYLLRQYDYGLAKDDTRATGIEHVSVTLNSRGDYPSFTIPRSDLERE